MKIIRTNYEAFFLDFHEGNLSAQARKDVLAFVDANPDLREEFERFEIISFTEQPAITFPGKEKLKKAAITEFNYKTWFVAYSENDLDEQGRREVEKFIEVNPAFLPELEQMNHIRLAPDYSIRFANRSSLKKGTAVIPMWVRVAAAACLVFGLLAYIFFQQKPQKEFVHAPQPSGKILPRDSKSAPEEIKPVIVSDEKVSVKNKVQERKFRKPAQQPEEQMANNDSSRAVHEENKPLEQPVVIQTPSENLPAQHRPVVVINENQQKPVQSREKMVVLDDQDLAELGLKKSTPVESKSILADAVNGAGKIFGINAHYDKEHNLLQSKYQETIALGPLAITRTVSR